MLNTSGEAPERQGDRPSKFAQHMTVLEEWDLERLLLVARRRARVLAGGVAVGLIAAVFYILVTVPQYTSVVDILLDTPKVSAVADSYETSNNAVSFEAGGVDSQVELLKSERIALSVIKKLDLKNNPVFAPKSGTVSEAIGAVYDFLLDTFGWRDLEADAARAVEADRVLERQIVESLGDATKVKRVGRTYVLELSHASMDRGLASSIANAYADAYLTDQLDAKYDATTRAAIWLQDRIGELKDKSLEADTKVQQFRSEHGLLAVDGKLVNEQQLVDANAQLSEARAKLADAEAKVQRIDTIAKTGSVDAVTDEALNSPVIADLRKKYLDDARREAEITKRLGADHIAAVNLRSEMKQYERLVFEELSRIGQSYHSDYQIAKSRLESLEENFRKMMAQTAGDNKTLVTLRELERESETYKELYKTFLGRYQQAIQQQSFPITDARVITSASPALKASWPKKGLLLALGFVLGGLLGAAGAFFLEMRDQVFRTGDQVQTELGLEFLGLLPVLAIGGHRPERETTATPPGVLGATAPRMRYALTAPLSGFAETLRATKVAADIALRAKKPKIIGVVSVLPSEGKTTVSKNLASLIASLGSRTILIDSDLRNPGLSRAVAPEATDGLVEVLKGSRSVTQVSLQEEESHLVVVPATVHRKLTNSSELLSSQAMQGLLGKLGEVFDYIVLDLPPMGPVIDVRAMADLVDAFVLVVEWGKTSRSLVRSTLQVEAEVAEKCLGVILNKVEQDKMKLYSGSEYRNYYYSKYSKYYMS
ncbi:MAG: polysaccharide biosynthesis tyrosine autokinase [Hyphomicrobiales bacterium]|nr:polysaccharide biosynthesis tyrosine autokinase [Hyphomicrobiales bacterium]